MNELNKVKAIFFFDIVLYAVCIPLSIYGGWDSIDSMRVMAALWGAATMLILIMTAILAILGSKKEIALKQQIKRLEDLQD